MLHCEQRAEHIGVEGRGIAVGRLLGDRAGVAFGASVVDGDVQPAKSFDRLRDKRAHFILTAHIGAHEFGHGAQGMQFPRQLQACIVMATRDNEVAAFACKGQRGGPSDSGQRTGDQDDLSAHVETPPKERQLRYRANCRDRRRRHCRSTGRR